MLRNWILTGLCGAVFLIGAAVARADTYRVLDGALDDAQTGDSLPLGGTVELSVAPFAFLVDDFRLEAGDQSFSAGPAAEFDGFPAAFLRRADSISYDGDEVVGFSLTSGAELLAVDADTVTFRTVQFRLDEFAPGPVVGHLPDTPLPRHFELRGSVYEVDQTFRLPVACPTVHPLPIQLALPVRAPTPLNGGGAVVIGSVITTASSAGGALTIRLPVPNLSVPNLSLLSLLGSGLVRTRVTLQFRIDGSIVEMPVYLSLPAIDAVPVGLLFTAPVLPPTLGELGITAPSGADVTFDDTGALTVTTDGDLFMVAEGFLDFPGLTSFNLVATGSITIDGRLELADGVDLKLQAGESAILSDIVRVGGDLTLIAGTIELADGVDLEVGGGLILGDIVLDGGVLTPVSPEICGRLQPIESAGEQRQIGGFWLRASAAADHFQCYDVKIPRGLPRFEAREVDLSDQFGDVVKVVGKPERLCAPVDKNGEGIADPVGHLTCYDLKDPKGQGRKPRFEPFEVRVSNQFGDDQILTLGRPRRLCVPSAKDLAESGVAPGDSSTLSLDHFLCYDARIPRDLPRFEPLEVALSDQFGDTLRLVKKPKSLCTPVDKNGEGLRDPEAHLTCYEIKRAEGEPRLRPLEVDVQVSNPFGDAQSFTARKAKTVCVPSQKQHVE